MRERPPWIGGRPRDFGLWVKPLLLDPTAYACGAGPVEAGAGTTVAGEGCAETAGAVVATGGTAGADAGAVVGTDGSAGT